MPSLLDMPDVAMKCILEKSDFRSILNLRKSCRDLRHFIDDLKPHVHLPYLQLKVHRESIQVTVPLDLLSFNISYGNRDDDGCIVRWSENCETILENSNFLNTVCKDIQSMLGLVKLDFFMVEFSAPNLLKILTKSLLKVKSFMLVFSEQSQIWDFLPILDPSVLEKLTITNGCHDFNTLLDLEKMEISKFKNCKELYIRRCYIKCSSEDLLQFKKIFVSFRELSLKMVMDLKEAFLRPSHMHLENFTIYSENCNQISQTALFEKLGPCSFFDPTHQTSRWIFEIPGDPRKVVDLSLSSGIVRLMRIDKT